MKINMMCLFCDIDNGKYSPDENSNCPIFRKNRASWHKNGVKRSLFRERFHIGYTITSNNLFPFHSIHCGSVESNCVSQSAEPFFLFEKSNVTR